MGHVQNLCCFTHCSYHHRVGPPDRGHPSQDRVLLQVKTPHIILTGLQIEGIDPKVGLVLQVKTTHIIILTGLQIEVIEPKTGLVLHVKTHIVIVPDPQIEGILYTSIPRPVGLRQSPHRGVIPRELFLCERSVYSIEKL